MAAEQRSIEVCEGGKPLGFLVVDSFVAGRSHGGVRMRRDVTREEIGLLAQGMTLKYGFLGLPFGGAKAGVVGDPEAPPREKAAQLAAFARALKPILSREIFVPAADMGTTLEEIRAMLAAAGVHYERRRLPQVSAARYTAHSVFAGLRELARFAGLRLHGLRVAIDGFGAVGSHLAELLADSGARIIAVSTSKGARWNEEGFPMEELLDARRRFGSRMIDEMQSGSPIAAESFYALDVDAICPCANIDAVQAGNIASIQASILCPAANHPWDPDLEPELDRRGVAYMPDFVVNTGGILGTLLAYATCSETEIVDLIEHAFARNACWILAQAKTRGVSIRALSEGLIDARRTLRAGERKGSLKRGLTGIGLYLHRRALAPGALVRRYARRYVLERLYAGLEGT